MEKYLFLLPQLVVMVLSDWPVAIVDKSAENPAHINVSCNAFISSQTWIT